MDPPKISKNSDTKKWSKSDPSGYLLWEGLIRGPKKSPDLDGDRGITHSAVPRRGPKGGQKGVKKTLARSRGISGGRVMSCHVVS